MQGSYRKLPLRTHVDGRHFHGRVQSLAAGLLRLPAIAAVCLLSVSDAALAVEAIAPIIVVKLDQAMLLQMSPQRRNIVLDDPKIARATYVPDSNQVVLTGISYGETRLTLLDDAGEVVATATVLVKEPDAGVTIYRGHERATYYDCDRRCQPGLQLGDADKQFADIGGQIRSRESKPAEPRTEGGGHL